MSIIVTEPEHHDPIFIPSGILDQYGNMICVVEETTYQGFIGFIPPWELEAITAKRELEEAKARKTKGKRRARNQQS